MEIWKYPLIVSEKKKKEEKNVICSVYSFQMKQLKVQSQKL